MTITLVKLDPRRPRVFHLAKVHGTCGSYWEETHAAITVDGSRAVWATNWSQDVGREQVFLMRLDMPKGSCDALDGAGAGSPALGGPGEKRGR